MLDRVMDLISRQNAMVRAQKPDPNHIRLSREVIDQWAPHISPGLVVDVGCGQGIARPLWKEHGFKWIGVTLGEDYRVLFEKGYLVLCEDMHELPSIKDAKVVYARHVLEHSPLPALAMARWAEIAPYIIVVVPAPGHGAAASHGHISVAPIYVWLNLFKFLGMEVLRQEWVEYDNPMPWSPFGSEYRFLLRRPE